MTGTAAVVLAAGQGSRFRASGGTTASKVLATLDGVPLVRRVAESALASAARPVIVVTGHARTDVEAALDGLAVSKVHNADFATGLASSLRTAIASLPLSSTGAVVLLADMPLVSAQLIDRLAVAAANADAVVPVTQGRRGNPVLLSRSLFAAVANLEGDAGARQLLRDPHLTVREVPFDGDASTLDIDEVADLARLHAPEPGASRDRS